MNAPALRRLALPMAVSLVVLGALATSASAATQWKLSAVHGPQNMAPGVVGQINLQAWNVGTSDSSGTYTISDKLPPGFVAIAASGKDWNCGGSFPTVPGATVACTSAALVRAPGSALQIRGGATPLALTIKAPLPPGSYTNVATITGGGAAASATETVPVNATLPGFGYVPGAFSADLFDSAAPNGALTAGNSVRQADSHPFELRVNFAYNLTLMEDPDNPDFGDLLYTTPKEHQRTLETRLPAGLIGNPEATPRCYPGLLSDNSNLMFGSCPTDTQVGTIDLAVNRGPILPDLNDFVDIPVYNLQPPQGYVAAFGFSYLSNPIYIVAEVDPADGHSVVTRIIETIELLPVRSAAFTMWGVPADPAHDALRVDPNATPSEAYGHPSDGPLTPFLSLPSQCDTAGAIRQRADSWQNPGAFTPWESGTEIKATGCGDPRFHFEPSISIQPTSHEAAAPTGLDVDLSIPQKADAFPSGSKAENEANAAKLYAPSGDEAAIVTPNVRTAVTHLPLGMAVNPSAADGLAGCSQAQIGLDDNEDPTCPDNSKIGTVEIDSALMPETMHGSIYQAKQTDNPFGSLLSFYTVAEGPGLTIKLAARVDADPETGQLTTTFTDNPQLAFSHYRLHFNGGQRAPLVNPPTCGTYKGTASVSSWNSSVPVASIGDTVEITSGPGGSPCVDSLGARPFAPGFDAKSLTPIAGAFSEFALDVSRADGMQELRGIETTLPPGLTGRLAGVPYCSEASIAAISTAPGSGLGQRLAPTCPAAGLVGHSDSAAGAGSLPFHTPGRVYLTGPYRGAPLSLAIVTPVVAGPLDLGSIVVRAALYVDPVSAQIHVVSDPIPDKIVAEGNGFPLNVRSVRVAIDRPGFALNPTNCSEMAVGGQLTSLQGAGATVSDRFQVGACAALGFKPKLGLRLEGKTGRGEHPVLRATLRMRGGNANVSRSAVTLPRSEFLDQGHIRTICTRVQYAADQCPAGSVYGHATAWSPLLDQPLQGPVYLRSSDHQLPDLVASLDGQIHIDLDGRIDSVNKGIRTTFELVPDAPVSRFVLTMRGGKRGLLQNSRNLCGHVYRASAGFDAHNGRVADLRPRLQNDCGGKARKKHSQR